MGARPGRSPPAPPTTVARWRIHQLWLLAAESVASLPWVFALVAALIDTGHESDFPPQPNWLLEPLARGLDPTGVGVHEAEVADDVGERQLVARRGGKLIRPLEHRSRNRVVVTDYLVKGADREQRLALGPRLDAVEFLAGDGERTFVAAEHGALYSTLARSSRDSSTWPQTLLGHDGPTGATNHVAIWRRRDRRLTS